MKTALVLASVFAFAPMAHAAQSLAYPGEEVHAPAVVTDEIVTAAYALANVADDAADLAEADARLKGIQGTYAGSYLNDLLLDTKSLKHSAQRLALLLDQAAASAAIDAELDTLEVKFLATNRGASKVSTQLYSQGKSFEGYQLRSTFTKIRSRYVYLQTLLAE